MSLKIAIVIPWFGKKLKGGAEQLAWQIASRLTKKRVDVTVLTTCSKQFISNWSVNHYKPGKYNESGVEILRFPVCERDSRIFDKINYKIVSTPKETLTPFFPPVNYYEEVVYVNENINSSELLQYIDDNQSVYDAFLFLPYLFPASINGAKIAGNKAILQPCLHDEGYAYLDYVSQSFRECGMVFYNSLGEQEIAVKIFGEQVLDKSLIIGSGVEFDDLRNAKETSPLIKENYILYLGRRDGEKNTDLLIKTFDEYVAKTKSQLKLVLAGPAKLPVTPKSRQIVDMGLVSEKKKINLLKNCVALINPSINESFSRVIFEAWFCKKPVIVHSECRATYRALESSGHAGWSADSPEAFLNVYSELEKTSAADLLLLGERGHQYAVGVADWDVIIDTYISELEKFTKRNNEAITPLTHDEIDRNVEIIIAYVKISSLDAVGYDIIQEFNVLKKHGYNVKLFAESIENQLIDCAISKDEILAAIKEHNTVLICHHANYWDLGEVLIENSNCKVILKYHNVTPHDFFRKYSEKRYSLCKSGREQTERMVKSGKVDFFIPDSNYNLEELVNYGVASASVGVLAPFCKMDHLNVKMPLLEKLTNEKQVTGRVNVLFVGRIVPNKGHVHLIEIIKRYIELYDDNIHLDIIGNVDLEVKKYYDELGYLVDKYRLWDNISFKHEIDNQELSALYYTSDVFLLMSEHEGFCVPVLEAQHHHVPVIALSRCAVPDTIGEEQIVFAEPDYTQIACAIQVICRNQEIKQYLIKKGQENLEKYKDRILSEKFIDYINKLVSK